MTETIEKRRQPRMKLKGYIANLADGHFVYDGIVEDISVEGLRLNNLPDRFVLENRTYNLVISGGPDAVYYKLKVSPRWIEKNDTFINVGFNIAQAPSNWETFHALPKMTDRANFHPSPFSKSKDSSMTETIEKRRQPRMKLKGYIADLADGHFVYDGIVEDISIEGLRLNDLPDRFVIEKNKTYNLVVSGGPDAVYYKLKVSPRWIEKNDIFINVGFNIAQAPTDWKAFVQQMIPKKKKNTEEEIWDQYSGSSRG